MALISMDWKMRPVCPRKAIFPGGDAGLFPFQEKCYRIRQFLPDQNQKALSIGRWNIGPVAIGGVPGANLRHLKVEALRLPGKHCAGMSRRHAVFIGPGGAAVRAIAQGVRCLLPGTVGLEGAWIFFLAGMRGCGI